MSELKFKVGYLVDILYVICDVKAKVFGRFYKGETLTTLDSRGEKNLISASVVPHREAQFCDKRRQLTVLVLGIRIQRISTSSNHNPLFLYFIFTRFILELVRP